jgi:DNA-binding transcriptional regulator YiaG
LNINKALAVAITKGTAKVARKPIAALRRDVADLKRQVAELKRHVRALQKGGQRKAVAAPDSEAETAKPSRIRPTGPMVRKLRAKLGLTQAQFAKLAGVSMLTVSKWETAKGRITPRRRTLDALAKVKVMSKRGAQDMLGGK